MVKGLDRHFRTLLTSTFLVLVATACDGPTGPGEDGSPDDRVLALTSPAADTTVTGRSLEFSGWSRGGEFVDVAVIRDTTTYQATSLALDRGVERAEFSGSLTRLVQGENRLRIRTRGMQDSVAIRVFVDVPVAHYSVTYLETLGGSDSYATDLNDAGQVVGYSETASGDVRAFLWENGMMRELTGRGVESQATAINEAGAVVGFYRRDDASSTAFEWQDGQVTDSLAPAGDAPTRALDVNRAGHILVQLDEAYEGIWDGSRIDTIAAGDMRRALRLNDQDVVLGEGGAWGGVLWQNGVATDIGRFGEFMPRDLNSDGAVAYYMAPVRGSSGTTGVRAAEGERTEFADVPFGSRSFAINDEGTVLGQHPASAGGRVFLWRDGAVMEVELDDPDWVIDPMPESWSSQGPMMALNNRTEFIAHARNLRTGEQGAVLLRPLEQVD